MRSPEKERARARRAAFVACVIGLVASLAAAVPLTATAQQEGDGEEAAEWDVTQARGDTREVNFVTEEGTWMSVDASPDESWLVFDLQGQIYRLPMEGGTAEPLTQNSGVAWNAHPRISPDGEHIAFISDREGQGNLWVMEADGSDPRAVYTDRDLQASTPVWTPDGEYIVVRREQVVEPGASGLVMYHREGGDGVELVSDEDVDGAAWPSIASEEGAYLYFQAAPGRGEALNGDFQLRRYNFETGRVVDMTSGNANGPAAGRLSSGGAYAPEVSPGGTRLAFGRQIPDGTISYRGHEFGPRSALWIRDLETGAERKVMDPIAVAIESGRGARILPGYDWVASGNAIVIAQGGKIRRLDVRSGEVETIPFQARIQRTISEQAYNAFRITDEPFQPQFLRWHTASPDGSMLAFQAVGQIWVMDLPDGTPRPLTPDDFTDTEFAPAWSPDGASIAFTTFGDRPQGHVWTIRVEGGSPVQLTEQAAFYTHPVWSPDGKEVLVTRGGGATARGRTATHNAFFDLVRIPAGGGPAAPVTRVAVPTGTSPGSYARRAIVQAAYGPEGRVFFPEPARPQAEGEDDLVSALVSVRPDGTDRQVHMTFPHADEVVPSPGGDWVAFEEGDNVYLTPFPYGGALEEPIHIGRRDSKLPVRQISREGGLFPKWRSSTTLEFGSAKWHYTYDTDTEEKDSTEVRFQVPQDLSEGSIALTNARVISFREEGEDVIENGTVVVQDARISCVGAAGDCDSSGADRVIDASGKTIMPGIIDMHAHHYREHRGHRPRDDYEVASYLAYGITTTLDNSMWSQNVFPTAERIKAGRMVGPRTYSTGDPLYEGDAARNNKITSYKAAQHNVRRLKSWGAVSIKQYSYPRRTQRQWIIDAARQEGLAVTGHWNQGVIMDGHTGWEHSLSYLPIYSDLAEFYGRANAVYSPTFVVGGPSGPSNIDKFFAERDLWKDEKQQHWMPWRMLTFLRRRTLAPDTDYSYPLLAEGVVDIVENGGHTAIGGHGEHHALAPHWNIWMLSEAAGALEALRAATVRGAYFLGATEDVGSIEEGKLADLLVLNANPLDDIRNTADLEYVMKGGVLREADSLDEVWPGQEAYGEKYWVDEESLDDSERPIDSWDAPGEQ